MEGEKAYKRVIPEHFTGDTPADDLFMRSVIKEAALEGKNKDGSPNGKFYMDKKAAGDIGMRVLEDNLKMQPDVASDHMNNYFEKAWKHYEIMGTGKIEAGLMPSFVRFLGGN